MATQSFRQSDGSFQPVNGSSASTFAFNDSSDADTNRRAKLAASDELLNEIEELCLADRSLTPPLLRERIQMLHLAISGVHSDARLKTLHTAHDFVLSMQQPLMVGNPRNPVTPWSAQRGPGQPATVTVPVAGAWKMLGLPTVPQAGLTEDWFALVAATLERAWDRWAYAQHHAIAAARRRSRYSRRAVARAVVAWSNYWQLLEEADRLRGLLASLAS